MFSSRSILRVLFATGLAVLGAIIAPQEVHAQCVGPREEGNWVNVDPNTRDLARIEIRFVCQDQILNGVPCCPPGPPYYFHIWGVCDPIACDWGTVGANRIGTGDLWGNYDQGFAKRQVFASINPQDPSQLWVTVLTDFVDPNRPDYTIQAFFKK
jgi:hypothetical protein